MYDEHSRGGYRGGRGGGGRGRGGGGGGDWGGGGGGGGGRGVPLSSLDPALTEVSRKLIGCAIEVHRNLGPGFDEAIYRKAVETELKAIDVPYETDKPYPVMYKDKQIGERTADMVVDGRFIVDLMASRGEIGGTERASLRALLRCADMELGLIINFAERRLKDGLVRVLNPEKLGLTPGGSHDDQGHDGHDEHDVYEHDDQH